MIIVKLKKKILGKINNSISRHTRGIGSLFGATDLLGIKIFADQSAHVFAGYYDVSPLDSEENRLLVLMADQDHTSPHDTQQFARIGYFDLQDGRNSFQEVAKTHTWNWQQGCRLQWLPHQSQKIIYNDFREGRFISVVYDLLDCKEREIGRPVYAVHPNGNSFLSLDFTRLHQFRRGYGYHQLAGGAGGKLAPVDDGIWSVDISTGSAELLLSLEEVASFSPRESMGGAFHYINHLQWSPDGSQILFFHLWANGGKSKNSRLLLLEKGQLSLVDDKIRPSHTAWTENGKLLVTGLRQGGDEMYHVYDLQNHEGNYYKNTIKGLCLDGHPSFLSEDEFISDTYPDLWGRQHLFKGDVNGNCFDIASFYLPQEFSGELRCDLHPRLSKSKKWAMCDVVINKKRAVALVPIESQRRNIL